MNQFLFSLLFFINWLLLANCSDYDEPNADMGDSAEIVELMSTSTTSSPKDKDLKHTLDQIVDFLRDHLLYTAIGAGLIVLCCLCACCKCICKKRNQRKHPQTGQYSYYTQV